MANEEARVGASTEPHRSRDSELVQALKGDRETAVELLMSEHGQAIGRLCLALLGSQSEAEDALQETLAAVLDGLESFCVEGSVRCSLASVARRRCARRLAGRTREGQLEQRLPAPVAAADTEQQRLARRARDLLEQLRPTEREALVLRFAGELSLREVGWACGVDDAAARKRVSRGMARLRNSMGDEE